MEKSSRRILDLVERSQVVVIVSHTLDQIRKLCNRVIVLHKGVIVNDGKPAEMIDFYVKNYVNSR